MRSWVIGRLPRAAARWSGVRASRGETHEFTWNIIMSLETVLFMCCIRNSRTFQLDANLFEWGVCQRKWYLCDVTPEARVWYLFMIIQQQEWCWTSTNNHPDHWYLHIASTSACAGECGAGKAVNHSFLSYLARCHLFKPLSWLLIDYIVTFFP